MYLNTPCSQKYGLNMLYLLTVFINMLHKQHVETTNSIETFTYWNIQNSWLVNDDLNNAVQYLHPNLYNDFSSTRIFKKKIRNKNKPFLVANVNVFFENSGTPPSLVSMSDYTLTFVQNSSDTTLFIVADIFDHVSLISNTFFEKYLPKCLNYAITNSIRVLILVNFVSTKTQIFSDSVLSADSELVDSLERKVTTVEEFSEQLRLNRIMRRFLGQKPKRIRNVRVYYSAKEVNFTELGGSEVVDTTDSTEIFYKNFYLNLSSYFYKNRQYKYTSVSLYLRTLYKLQNMYFFNYYSLLSRIKFPTDVVNSITKSTTEQTYLLYYTSDRIALRSGHHKLNSKKTIRSSNWRSKQFVHLFKRQFFYNLFKLNGLVVKNLTNVSYNYFYKNNFIFTFGLNNKNMISKSDLSQHLTVKLNTQPLHSDFYNNYYPIFLYNYTKKKHFSIISTVRKVPFFSLYYVQYLLTFLEMLTQSKVWVKLNTTPQVKPKTHNYLNNLFFKNKNIQKAIGKHFYLLECYEILFLSLLNRDLKFFALWFKRIMEKIHIRKHKKFCKIIESTLRHNTMFLQSTNVKGFSLDIRGKLGTAGNSKKKHYFFVVGGLGFTTKEHGLTMYQTTVRTHTGVLGITFFLSY